MCECQRHNETSVAGLGWRSIIFLFFWDQIKEKNEGVLSADLHARADRDYREGLRRPDECPQPTAYMDSEFVNLIVISIC